ncbi:uncharacterized protein LOC134823903 [Bolinopsis microptera]|uniref:uncharacterized protein LOC134823903 n=1 Tax=Bolinopsis microptera TaxID=2820187 RepID=UPI00307A40F8
MNVSLWRSLVLIVFLIPVLSTKAIGQSDRFKKGIFCEACDLLNMRYCYEQRCDRSHFCYKTETASGCSNPYMHKIQECRNMHRGDCCFARQDLHGKRFNTTQCAHHIPKVMCHSCTRMGGCKPISCGTGNLCYANRFESGCANTSSYEECNFKNDKCCEGRTALRAWNATQCQAEPAPVCETCPPQRTTGRLKDCSSASCPGLCFIKQFNFTRVETSKPNYTTEYTETGCSPSHLNVQSCNSTHQQCCTSHNSTDCYHNYHPNTASAEVRFFIAFFLILAIMGFVLCLCFSDSDDR